MSDTVLEIILWVIAIGILLLEEFVFANTRYFWLGGIIPLAGTILLVYIFITTTPKGFSDYLLPVLGFFVLLQLWDNGHQKYLKRTQKQKKQASKK